MTLSSHYEPYILEIIFGFSGRTLDVFIKIFPPVASAATSLSLTGIIPIACSNITSKYPDNSTNLVIDP